MKELLIDDQNKVDSDIAIRALRPVKNEASDVESYNVSL